MIQIPRGTALKKLITLCCVSLALTACSTVGKSGGVGLVAGQITEDSNADKVSVFSYGVMSSEDTLDVALKHCAKFDKKPKLVREAKWYDFSMKDQYDCVAK
jgi:hypothetical protein